MARGRQERLIELYEKGVLTKEEARACFLELEERPDSLFLEEGRKQGFTLPSFKVFSSSKLKQDYRFEGIDSLFISLVEGKITFVKGKQEHIQLSLVYPPQEHPDLLPKIYVEKRGLHFASSLPCQLVLSLPDRWLSVLELKIGKADVRLDYLPFEDMSISSKTDKKQQDIRLTTEGRASQHLFLQLQQAPVHLHVPKQQGIRGQLESGQSHILVNRKKKASPYFCEKTGDSLLYVQMKTEKSPIYLKGVRDAIGIV